MLFSQDLDPLLVIKKCDERAKPLKMKVQILTLPKYFTTPPLCIFEPQNSHFSLICEVLRQIGTNLRDMCAKMREIARFCAKIAQICTKCARNSRKDSRKSTQFSRTFAHFARKIAQNARNIARKIAQNARIIARISCDVRAMRAIRAIFVQFFMGGSNTSGPI